MALLALAAALRYRFVVDLNPPSAHLYSDMLAFVQRAQNVLDGHFVPWDTRFPPGAHLLLALSGFLFDGYDTLVVWTHLTAGVLTCYWMWRASEPYLGRTGRADGAPGKRGALPVHRAGRVLPGRDGVHRCAGAARLSVCDAPVPVAARHGIRDRSHRRIRLAVEGNPRVSLPILAAWSIGWAFHRSAATRPEQWRRVRRAWVFILVGVALVLGAQTWYFHQYYGRWLPIAAEGGAVFALGKCPGARIIEKNGAQYRVADSPLALRIWFWGYVLITACLTLGLFARLASILALGCLVLLQARNPYMLFGADVLFFQIGLWLPFLRLDAAWSLGRKLGRSAATGAPPVIPLWPLKTIQIQVALVYFVTAVTKLGTDPWRDGSAVYYALNTLGSDVAPGLLQRKLLLTLMTYGTLWIELSFAFLVF